MFVVGRKHPPLLGTGSTDDCNSTGCTGNCRRLAKLSGRFQSDLYLGALLLSPLESRERFLFNSLSFFLSLCVCSCRYLERTVSKSFCPPRLVIYLLAFVNIVKFIKGVCDSTSGSRVLVGHCLGEQY
jgi:hypothetical protein